MPIMRRPYQLGILSTQKRLLSGALRWQVTAWQTKFAVCFADRSQKWFGNQTLLARWGGSDAGFKCISGRLFCLGMNGFSRAMDHRSPALFTRGEISHMRIWSAG
jgi:hypothetical protein